MVSLFLTALRLLKALWRGMHEKTFRTLLFLYFIIQLSGTLFYHQVEGWSWLDSLWFSVSTSATINTGHAIPQTEWGKFFTIIFLLVSVGVFFSLAFKVASILVNPANSADDDNNSPEKQSTKEDKEYS